MVDRADMDYIKKMAKDVCRLDRNCDECNMAYECKAIDYATRFYDAHYRKQEWISVEERLPDSVGKYLVFTLDRRVYLCDFIDHYCDGDAQFDDYRVTHWVPLPESPKGGETDA